MRRSTFCWGNCKIRREVSGLLFFVFLFCSGFEGSIVFFFFKLFLLGLFIDVECSRDFVYFIELFFG